MNEKVINFCRAPSGLWIGWLVRNNAHYWGSGRTLDLCAAHVKGTLYQAHKKTGGISTAGYYIASKPTAYADVPVDLMDKKFKTRAWFGGTGKEYVNNKPEIVKKAPTVVKKVVEEPHYDYYETAMDGHDLVVYGVIKKQVARYNTIPAPVSDVKPADIPAEQPVEEDVKQEILDSVKEITATPVSVDELLGDWK